MADPLDDIEQLQTEPDDLMYRASMQAAYPALAARVRAAEADNAALRARVAAAAAVVEAARNVSWQLRGASGLTDVDHALLGRLDEALAAHDAACNGEKS